MVDAADLKSKNRQFCKCCGNTKNGLRGCNICCNGLVGFCALWRVLAELLHNYFTISLSDLALSLTSSWCAGALLRVYDKKRR